MLLLFEPIVYELEVETACSIGLFGIVWNSNHCRCRTVVVSIHFYLSKFLRFRLKGFFINIIR